MKKLKNRKKKRNLALAVTGTGVAFIGVKTYFNNRRKKADQETYFVNFEDINDNSGFEFEIEKDEDEDNN